MEYRWSYRDGCRANGCRKQRAVRVTAKVSSGLEIEMFLCADCADELPRLIPEAISAVRTPVEVRS